MLMPNQIWDKVKVSEWNSVSQHCLGYFICSSLCVEIKATEATEEQDRSVGGLEIHSFAQFCPATQFTLDSHQALTQIHMYQQISDLVKSRPEFFWNFSHFQCWPPLLYLQLSERSTDIDLVREAVHQKRSLRTRKASESRLSRGNSRWESDQRPKNSKWTETWGSKRIKE